MQAGIQGLNQQLETLISVGLNHLLQVLNRLDMKWCPHITCLRTCKSPVLIL